MSDESGLTILGPSSNPVESGSGLPSTIQEVTDDYTAVDGDFVLADATTGALTITLPATGAVIVVKTDASANAVAVDATINGDAGGMSIGEQDWGSMFASTATDEWRTVSFTASASDGADGTDGVDGIDGANGLDGRTILNGTGVPSGGTGANGDFYIRTDAPVGIYGPKTGGAWGSATALVGPQGPAGTNGTNGTNGANGTNATLSTIENEGSALTARATMNFVGSAVDVADSGGKTVVTVSAGIPEGVRVPADNNLKMWAASTDLVSQSGFQLVAGKVQLREMPIRGAQTITTIHWALEQALAVGGGGAANLFFGVYTLASGTLTLIGKTSDRVSQMSGPAGGAGVAYSATLTAEAGQSLALDGTKRVWGAAMIGTQGSTTIRLYRFTAFAGIVNAGLVAGTDPLIGGQAGSGLSALPATIAVSTLVNDYSLWFGAS